MPAASTDWNERYATGETPWDSGQPSLELQRILQEDWLQPCRVLELGCGTGTNAVWLARHGESAGNRARDEAEANGSAVIDLPTRDMDVPLSDLGERQATALGRWIGEMEGREQPTVVLVSSYVRAKQTAEIALKAAGLEHLPRVYDERLREREFGVLDGLTKRGIKERFPDEAERRHSSLGYVSPAEYEQAEHS